MKEIRLSEWIGEGFYDIHRDIREGRHTHYWLKGGRGSGKSSFLSLEILLGLIADRDANAVVLRKVAANLRDSVFEQMNWAIHALGVEEEWEKKISPMELIRKGTGQKILFRGCDDPKKLKSIKFQRGYAKFIWYEEADEFGEHDSLQKDFRRSPISETKENGEEELRMFFNPNRSNHHCVHPFHHTLVAQKTAYLVGREPTISVRNGDRAFEEMLTELADEHFNGMLQSWLTGAANKGVEYLHVYYDGEGNFRYCIVPAEEIIAIYDEEYQQELREVIRYYDIKVLDEGREKTKRRVEWWTAEDVTYFTENGDGEFLQEKSCGHWAVTALLDGEETETEQHGWGRVPFIPLRNNEKELTDLQLVKGLIDAYDLVSSEGTNNLLDLVDLYWVIQGYGGETASAVAKKLQINKAVQISDSSGNVEAKQVQLPVEGRLDWMQMLRKDIFHFGMGVDTDSDDWGKAASGVALKFQYAMFYLKINGIVPEIKRAVKEFFRFATEDWNRENGTDWDWRKIQITLNTNGITDDMETMQIIAASKGMVSEKTLLGKHPFVEDVNSEMEQLERERKEKDNEIDTDD